MSQSSGQRQENDHGSAPSGTVDGAPPRGLLALSLRAPLVLYHLHLGWLLGNRFLVLKHTGRKSAVVHSTVLEVVRYDPLTGQCIVASGWGEKSQWLQNVQANPRVRFILGRQCRDALAKRMAVEAAKSEFRDYGRRHPYALRRLAAWMLGEKPADQETMFGRLAEAVPLVELSPVAEGT